MNIFLIHLYYETHHSYIFHNSRLIVGILLKYACQKLHFLSLSSYTLLLHHFYDVLTLPSLLSFLSLLLNSIIVESVG